MKILYLCTGNSARSQMAEAITRSLLPAGAPIEVFSAGTHPKEIHPQTIAVMQEIGLDLGACRSKGLADVPFDTVDLVVTLCDDARRSCPVPHSAAHRIHWGIRDPAAAEGSAEQVRDAFRDARDEVQVCVKRLMFELATTRSLRGAT